MGKAIAEMNLGEAPKRMHDPQGLLENHFLQEHTKIGYAHQEIPDDSIYIGANNFSDIVSMISIPMWKTHIF